MGKTAMPASVSQINPSTQQGTYHTMNLKAFAENGQGFFYSQLSRPTTGVKEAANWYLPLLASEVRSAVTIQVPSSGHTLKNIPLDPNSFYN